MSLALVIAVAYGWTLGAYFSADDFGLVGRYISFPWSSWPGLFTSDWSAGIWSATGNELRPFAALTFMVDAWLWGVDPAGYHLTSLLLHFVCSGLVMLIAFEALGFQWRTAFPAGVLFALHPATAKATVWVSGRVELLSGVGFLLGFYAFLRYRREPRARWLMAAWGAFGFGIFSKESCLLLPAVVLGYDLLNGGWRKVLSTKNLYIGWALLLGVYAYCRSFGLDNIIDINVMAPATSEAWMKRLIAYTAGMFLTFHVIEQYEPVLAPYLGALALIVTLSLAAMAWALWRGRQASVSLHASMFYGLVWPLMTTAPLLVTYLSLRHLYTAAAGFAIGVLALLASTCPRRPRFVIAASVAIALAGTQQAMQNARWSEALDRSRQISETVATAARLASAGDVLFIDVPAEQDDMWVWAWATPFALRPPFAPRDVTRELIVVEKPKLYRHPASWPRQGTRTRLRAATGAAWLITSGTEGGVTLRKLDAAEFDALRAGHTLLKDHEAFDELIDSLGGSP